MLTAPPTTELLEPGESGPAAPDTVTVYVIPLINGNALPFGVFGVESTP
jgi:hypothetical protein